MTTSAEFKYSLENIKLDELTTISLSTDTLRLNFEIILYTLKTFGKRLDVSENGFNQTNKESQNQIDQLNQRILALETKGLNDKKEIDDQIKQIQNENSNNKEKYNEMNSKTENIKSDVNNIKDDIINLKDNVKSLADQITKLESNMSVENQNFKKRLDENDKSIQEIYQSLKLIGSGNNGNLNPNDLIKILHDHPTNKDFEEFSSNYNLILQKKQESIDDIYKILDELKNKVSNKVDCDNYDEHLNDYNRTKAILMNIANSKLSEDDNKLDIMNELKGTAGPSLSTKDANLLKELSVKFPEIENLLKKLQRDLNDHLQQNKIYIHDTNKRISTLESEMKKFRDEMQKKLHSLEELTKLSPSNLDKGEQKSINLGVPHSKDPARRGSFAVSDPHDSSTTIKKLQSQILMILESDKERDTKLHKLFEELADFKQIKTKLNNTAELVNEDRSRISTIEEDLADLKALKGRLEILENSSLKETKKNKKGVEDTAQNGPSINLEEIKKMVYEMLDNFKEEQMKIIEELRNIILKKVNAEDLWKSECIFFNKIPIQKSYQNLNKALILEKLDQVVGGLINKLADKSDMKKALLFLEKKIKDISILIFGDPSQGEEGAMFAKKPWTPWNCASCDTKLQKYPGALVDHKNWNKFPPNETSPERITQGKFGKGWVKWTDKQKTLDKFRETTKEQQVRPGTDSLPHIQPNIIIPKDEGSTKNSAKQYQYELGQ